MVGSLVGWLVHLGCQLDCICCCLLWRPQSDNTTPARPSYSFVLCKFSDCGLCFVCRCDCFSSTVCKQSCGQLIRHRNRCHHRRCCCGRCWKQADDGKSANITRFVVGVGKHQRRARNQACRRLTIDSLTHSLTDDSPTAPTDAADYIKKKKKKKKEKYRT